MKEVKIVMLRELLSSRLILAGLVILVVVAGACWYYSWHVQRTNEAEVAKNDAILQLLKNDDETHDAQDTVDIIPVDSEQVKKPLGTDDMTVSPVDNATDMLNTEDVSIPEEAPAEDVPVSPFGFGPYPEIPEDMYGTVS